MFNYSEYYSIALANEKIYLNIETIGTIAYKYDAEQKWDEKISKPLRKNPHKYTYPTKLFVFPILKRYRKCVQTHESRSENKPLCCCRANKIT